jgi:hypothetical protein
MMHHILCKVLAQAVKLSFFFLVGLMTMAGYPDSTGGTDREYEIMTTERIVEVPMVQIVEKIVYVQTSDVDAFKQDAQSYEDQLEEAFAHVERASFESPLAVAADPDANLYHPREAYWSEDKQKSLEFFRDNGFVMIPDAVPKDVIDAARNACIRDGVRDNGSPEVLAAVTQKLWDIVEMIVDKPVYPQKAQVAKVVKYMPEGEEAARSVEATKQFYFPQDMHIDGLPNEATSDINNFSCLLGIPLDATTIPFSGNFGVSPGSHVRIQNNAKKDGYEGIRTNQWLDPLKKLAEVKDYPFLGLRAVPGQAYIAHYQTVHFAMPNFHGADPRRVMYFRIWNDRGGKFTESTQNYAAITNVFLEMPRITGEPVPVKPLEKKVKKTKSKEKSGPPEMITKFEGHFLPAGGDIYAGRMTVADAKEACKQLPACQGFTFLGKDDDAVYDMFFKDIFQPCRAPPDQVWTSFNYNAPFMPYNGYMPNGGDLLQGSCTIEEAKCKALELVGCQGFCYQGGPTDEGTFMIHWKDKWEVCGAPPTMQWTSWKYEGPPILVAPPGCEQPLCQQPGVHTVEKIVEVPMVQLVEVLLEVDPKDMERMQKETDERNRRERERIINEIKESGHGIADMKSPLCIPHDPASKLYHPIDAYLGEDQAKACRFFRDNGFLMLNDAVPEKLLKAARSSVTGLGVRDIGSEEVLAALRESKCWEAVKMLVEDPQFPAKCQVASVPRVATADCEASEDVYFPNDMHIDGLPSGATTDIMNFTCLVGIPLDPTEDFFMGNFGVLPGSHRRLEESFKREGMDALRTSNWTVNDLKRLSGVGEVPFCPLRAVPGQAYIAHYQTVHFVMPNGRGADPRRVMYFRIWSRRERTPDKIQTVPDGEGSYMIGDMSLMTDIFREYPNVRNA